MIMGITIGQFLFWGFVILIASVLLLVAIKLGEIFVRLVQSFKRKD